MTGGVLLRPVGRKVWKIFFQDSPAIAFPAHPARESGGARFAPGILAVNGVCYGVNK